MIYIEQIKNLDDVERARSVLRSELRGIEETIQRANQAAIDAKAEIANLGENVLPNLLAERFLDEKISKTEITKIKKRKAELQEIIDDNPFLLKGLEAKKQKPNSEARKVEHRERSIQNYERIKNALKQKYSPSQEQSLLHQSENLGCEADAKKFLADLRNQVKS